MRAIAHANGHHTPWLLDEFVPCVAAVIEYGVVCLERAIGPPVVSHEPPDILDRVEFWKSTSGAAMLLLRLYRMSAALPIWKMLVRQSRRYGQQSDF